MHEGIGGCEGEAPRAEGVRDRGREHKPREHEDKQEQPNRRALGIEPVGDPGGVNPDPPDGEKKQTGAERAEEREVLEQEVRELRNREHKDEIEEQLDVGHAGVAPMLSCPKKRAASVIRHRPWSFRGRVRLGRFDDVASARASPRAAFASLASMQMTAIKARLV